MQWFKHMTDMSFDPKVKRTIRRYGVEGYGLYCYVLESIARGLSEASPYPELEDMSEDIAADLKMDSRRVEEVMMFMVQQGLFDWRDASSRIICMKMIDYLDEYTRKKGKASPIRKALQDIEVRHCPDKLLTMSGDVAQEEEEDKEEEEEKKKRKRSASRFAPPTVEDVFSYGREYCQTKGFPRFSRVEAEKIVNFYESKNWMVGKAKMKDWNAAVRNWILRDAPEVNPAVEGSQERAKKAAEIAAEKWKEYDPEAKIGIFGKGVA
jgi:hypothetical protein